MAERKKMHERRMALRDGLWPNARGMVWSRKDQVGFSTVPRLLPWVCALVKDLTPSGDPSAVYIDLWCRVFDEGLVEISDESECAFASGYSGTRAVRTWRERMFALQELGFIHAKPLGLREYARILISDPIRRCVQIRTDSPSKVPNEWWYSFEARADAIGTDLAKYIAEAEAQRASKSKRRTVKSDADNGT